MEKSARKVFLIHSSRQGYGSCPFNVARFSSPRTAFSCTGQRENVTVAGIKEYGRLVPRRTHILVSGRFRGIVVLLRTGSRRPARRAGPRFFVLRPRLSRERRTFLNSKWTFLPGERCQVGARWSYERIEYEYSP